MTSSSHKLRECFTEDFLSPHSTQWMDESLGLVTEAVTLTEASEALGLLLRVVTHDFPLFLCNFIVQVNKFTNCWSPQIKTLPRRKGSILTLLEKGCMLLNSTHYSVIHYNCQPRACHGCGWAVLVGSTKWRKGASQNNSHYIREGKRNINLQADCISMQNCQAYRTTII